MKLLHSRLLVAHGQGPQIFLWASFDSAVASEYCIQCGCRGFRPLPGTPFLLGSGHSPKGHRTT